MDLRRYGSNSGGPPRDLLLLWLITHDRLKTASLLWHHRAIPTPSCTLCGEQFEDTLHALRDCRYASRIWAAFLPRAPGDQFWELRHPTAWVHWNFRHCSTSCSATWNWKYLFRQVIQSIWH